MYNYYDMDENPIEKIEYVKNLYDIQEHKVEQEKYMKDLLFADYVRKVKSNLSRYDYMDDVFSEAGKQVNKKLKKERLQFEAIQNFIIEDFLNGNKNFKLKNIVTCGYEGYAKMAVFEGYGQSFEIAIPIMKNITTKNIEYAYDGMFAFSCKDIKC